MNLRNTKCKQLLWFAGNSTEQIYHTKCDHMQKFSQVVACRWLGEFKCHRAIFTKHQTCHLGPQPTPLQSRCEPLAFVMTSKKKKLSRKMNVTSILATISPLHCSQSLLSLAPHRTGRNHQISW